MDVKKLSIYLPYDVQCYIEGDANIYGRPHIETILGVFSDGYVSLTLGIDDIQEELIDNIKLLLLPITMFGEYFHDLILNNELSDEDLHVFNTCKDFKSFAFKTETAFDSYSFINLLAKHHFDVFGLIDKGRAVDINSLNNMT